MQEVKHLLQRYQDDFSAVLDHEAELQSLLQANSALHDDLHKLWLGSDYAADLCINHPSILLDLLLSQNLNTDYVDWQAHLLEVHSRWTAQSEYPIDEQAQLKKFLRLFRKREMLRILWRDIIVRVDVMQTCNDLTQLADCCVNYAITMLTPLCQRMHGLPLDAAGKEQELIVLAMGKYGAFELNLSSDIDLIYVFPENGETTISAELQTSHPRARPCTIQQYFSKLGQLLISALDSTTSDGQVFRVDLRLRPYGDAGALALSTDAMEEYYQTQGRDWERFAMIKVRAVCGETAAIKELMSMLRSFSYRRYIDFATIDSLRDLKRQIEQQVQRKGMQQNIKLGKGGIREIEFIVQVLQLIYGGRHKHLQRSSIFKAMLGLVQEGCIPAEDIETLKQCYLFLRRVEHAIQGLQDKQTHEYPDDLEQEYRIALTLGYEKVESLRVEVESTREKVSELFSRVISKPQSSDEVRQDDDMQQVWLGNVDSEKAESLLVNRGYKDSGALLKTIKSFQASKQFLSMESASRQRMDRFMPHLLASLSEQVNPDLGFVRVFEFVQAVARRSVYLILLLENHMAMSQLLKLCTASPWIVKLLSRYPVLLDELLRPLDSPPDRLELQNKLHQSLLRTATDDIDDQLVTIQNFKQEQMLLVAAAELSGTLALMKVSDYLTWVAEVVLERVLGMAWQMQVSKYGYPVNASGESGEMDFIIIGYGKLGGIELNYGSDLDLVFMHDGHADEETSGNSINGHKINSSAFYVQLGQKVLSLLNTQTMSGKLYEIDLRLRPSGASGALVCSVDAFKQYQHEHAWTWEHQALVRARVVTGPVFLTEAFEGVRCEVLSIERNRSELAQEIVSMRAKMRAQLGSKNPAENFQLKHDSGGLVDIEFLVQFLVLAHAHEHPVLLRWSDNIRLLDSFVSTKVLKEESVLALQQIYIEFRSLLHKRALDDADYSLPSSEFVEQRAVIVRIWDEFFSGIEPGPLKGVKAGVDGP